MKRPDQAIALRRRSARMRRIDRLRRVAESNEHAAKIKFAVSSPLSLALNALWVFVTVNRLALPPEYSVIVILFLTPVATFLLFKFWVFA